MNFASTIEPDELNQLPLKSFGGNIHLISGHREADIAVKKLFEADFIGFDTETRPSFKKGKINPVALLQLATRNDAYIFRISRIGFHEGLQNLLSSPSPLKIGAAIHDDIRILRTVYQREPAGFLELQDLVGKYGIENIGVKKMAAIVLGIRISKSQQLSNWDAETLTDAQQIYAATDAWVALEIYLKLLQNGTP